MGVLLIVEDEQKIGEILSEYLNMQGHRVIKHVSGEAALSWLRENRADVVLLDIKMPDVNGLEFLRRMKDMGVESKVVMISALRDSGTIEKALELGAHGYLTKPFGLEDVKKSISGLLENAS